VIAKPGDVIEWFPESGYDPEQAFIDIILKIDGNIIGYAVVKVWTTNGDHSEGLNCIFTAKLLKSALIPKIDGEYQNVTEAQVKAAIETIKERSKEENMGAFLEVETEDMIDCSLFFYSVARSSIGDPIELKYSDENAVFECTVDEGSFDYGQELLKSITLKPGGGFYWTSGPIASGTEQAFVEIILKLDDYIIGYAVVEIYQVNNLNQYTARVLHSALIPKVDGKYQNVTEEQIKIVIDQIKNN
jgi:hypothetical protein